MEMLASFLKAREIDSRACRILNAGAGQSASIERQLTEAGCRYVCDRLDIEDCCIDDPAAGECWRCSISDMEPVASGRYVAVFSNYVLEHVEEIKRAAEEVRRVLAPGGIFLATVPNTSAPEFVFAKHTPLWFHRRLHGGRSWETQYAYESIAALLCVFRESGFRVIQERRWPVVYGYLGKYPGIGKIGKLYDKMVDACGCGRLMGDVCVVVQKTT